MTPKAKSRLENIQFDYENFIEIWIYKNKSHNEFFLEGIEYVQYIWSPSENIGFSGEIDQQLGDSRVKCTDELPT